MSKIVPCIWCDYTAEEAAQFYVGLLPDSRILNIQRSPVDTPSQKAGDILLAEIELAGQRFLLLNGGPQFPHSEAVSFQIMTDSQEETDRLWSAIVGNGGQESACGWCKDKWGLCWQITPRRLIELISDADPARARRAMSAMMTMHKIDIATIEAAAG
ncbi:MAG: VOC family protein [Pseudomonadota bacterium]